MKRTTQQASTWEKSNVGKIKAQNKNISSNVFIPIVFILFSLGNLLKVELIYHLFSEGFNDEYIELYLTVLFLVGRVVVCVCIVVWRCPWL